jgi:hypothetical protein
MSAAVLAPTLSVALKEWASVCQALGTGRQILLLRKGGIYESAGEFELEHREFVFFPTYLHQNLRMLKPEAQEGFAPHAAEPRTVTLSLAGRVTDIVQVSSRGQMDRLDTEHIWTAPLIDMRFNYRPENPLYVLVVRAYRLATPVVVENTPAYAGCKSWVPLDAGVSTVNATAVSEGGEFELRRRRIIDAISEKV